MTDLAEEPFLALKVGPFSCFCVHLNGGLDEASLELEDDEYGAMAQKSVEREPFVPKMRAAESGLSFRAESTDMRSAPSLSLGELSRKFLGEDVTEQLGLDASPALGSTAVPEEEESDDEEADSSLKIKPREQIAHSTKLGWVHCILKRLWPKVNKAIQKKMEARDLLSAYLPSGLKGLSPHFTKFDLGDDCYPRVRLVEVWSAPCQKRDMNTRGVEIHLDIDYESKIPDGEEKLIELALGPAKATVESITLRGELVLRLDPLMQNMPIIGGVAAYFLHTPEVEVKFGGVAHGVEKLADKALTQFYEGGAQRAIQQMIESRLVLPNMIGRSLAKDEEMVDSAMVKYAKPVGMLRVSGMSARGLTGVDWHLLSMKRLSDPYVRMRLSAEEWTSSTVYKTCDPDWESPDDTHDFLVYDREQLLQIEVHDWGHMKYYDVIGRAKPILVVDLLENSNRDIKLYRGDANLELEDPGPTCGCIAINFEWLSIQPESLADTNGAIVRVKVDEVYVPQGLKEEGARLHVQVVAENWTSKVYQRALQERKTTAKAAQHMSSTTMNDLQPAMRSQEVEENKHYEAELEWVQDFILPPRVSRALMRDEFGFQANTLGLAMWVENKKGKRIGEIQKSDDNFDDFGDHGGICLVKVAETQMLTMSWPPDTHFVFPENKSEFLQFKNPADGNMKSYAMVTVHLQGIKLPNQEVAKASMIKRKQFIVKPEKRENSQDSSYEPEQRSRSSGTCDVPRMPEYDTKSIEWLNGLFGKLWPRLMKNIAWMIENPYGRINSKLAAKMPWYLPKLRFSKFNLGKKSPVFGPLTISQAPKRPSALPGADKSRGIELKFGFHMISDDGDIELSSYEWLRQEKHMDHLKLGIQKMELKGDLIIRLELLLEEFPIVGGIVVCFLDPPDVKMEFSGLGEHLERWTTAGRRLREIITENISLALVMPNVMGWEIGTEKQGVDRALLRQPRPIYVLRVKNPRVVGLTHCCNDCCNDCTRMKVSIAGESWEPEQEDGQEHEFMVFDSRQRLYIEVRVGPRNVLKGCSRPNLTVLDLADNGKPTAVDIYDAKALKALKEKASPEVPLETLVEQLESIGHVEIGSDLLEPKQQPQAGDDDLMIVRVKVDEVYVPQKHLFGDIESLEDRSYYLFGAGAMVRSKIGNSAWRNTPIAKYLPLAPSERVQRASTHSELDDETECQHKDMFIPNSRRMTIEAIRRADIPVALDVEFILWHMVERIDSDSDAKLYLQIVDRSGRKVLGAADPISLATVSERANRKIRWGPWPKHEGLVFKDTSRNSTLECQADVEVSFISLHAVTARLASIDGDASLCAAKTRSSDGIKSLRELGGQRIHFSDE